MSWPAALVMLSALTAPGVASSSFELRAEDLGDLTELSLEELLNIEVTVSSRSEQRLSEVPGAVYVITGDEIRRSGHSSIQEALRMVPGMYVSNWTTSKWDVTSRGFGNGTSVSSLAYLNQLMVLIDGVPVSTPLFAGTWWALQDIDLVDVDRIEIVRGPGGILWGANAVHGVVHVITKAAADTQGPRSTVRNSNDERHQALRHGGTFGETGSYRVYTKWAAYDTNHNPFLGYTQDWGIASGGARFEWGAEGERQSKVWGRYYTAMLGADGFDLVDFVPIPVTDEAHGFQLHYTTTNAEGDQTFTSWISQDVQDLETELDIDILTADLEYRRDFTFNDHSKLSAGVGYRNSQTELLGDDPFWLSFDPVDKELSAGRAFAVQTWTLLDDRLDVVLGGQIEHNNLSGFEVQPTVRVSYHPESDFTVWGSMTRSVRTPSLEETHMEPGNVIVGNPDFQSEKVTSLELGLRKQLTAATAVDVALFVNDYDDLHVVKTSSVTFEDVFTNDGEGHSHGVEVAIDAKPSERWSLRSAYSFMHGDFEDKEDGSSLGTEDKHPKHQFNLRSYYDLSEDWELDAGVYVSESFHDTFKVAERTRFDLRLGWEPWTGLEVFFGGQQLGSPTQTEFDGFDKPRREIFFGLTLAPSSRD